MKVGGGKAAEKGSRVAVIHPTRSCINNYYSFYCSHYFSLTGIFLHQYLSSFVAEFFFGSLCSPNGKELITEALVEFI